MIAPADVTGIVLAGGRSSRFGGPKLAVEIDGRSLLEHAITAVAAVAEAVVVAGAPAPASMRIAAVRSVPDPRAFDGPLAGLTGALRGVTTPSAIVVGGDMPGLVPAVIRSMLDRLATAPNIDAVVLGGTAAGAKRQVLPLAINVVAAATAAGAALSAGDRSLVRLLERLRFVEIPAAEWLLLDPAGRTLLDVDRPADVDRIRHELR